jgi:two-component system response regulator ChvI
MSERKRNRLLIVDDEPDITTTFKLLLEDCGFEVDTYNDPQIALSDFRPGFYDLLLLDIRMPIINGFDLYDKMKVIDNKVNVCFMSAYDVNYELLRQQFPWLEVQCFIPKPVEISEIVRRVNREIVLTTV